MANLERTFIAVKPDGVQRGLVGEIIKRLEQKGFRLVALKLLRASEEHLKQHYIDLKDRPFFPGLVKYMNSVGAKPHGFIIHSWTRLWGPEMGGPQKSPFERAEAFYTLWAGLGTFGRKSWGVSIMTLGGH
uniref:Nucleoside diphosphate kinase A n=1 Tax=Microcebus murinus TaxID=30608 RepID=A0A8C5Y0N8_MICMU